MIDGIAMEGRKIIIPFLLQKQVLQQFHSNHMGIEKMMLLAHELVYRINVSTDIEHTAKQCGTCMEYQQAPHKPWKVVHADIFTFKIIYYCVLLITTLNFLL